MMNPHTCSVALGAGLAALGLVGIQTAAQPAPQEVLPANYQFEIELGSKDGPTRLFKVVTAGEWVRAGFVVPPATPGESDPSMLRLEAELQVMSPDKLWVRNLTLAHQLPPSRHAVRPVLAPPLAEPGGEPGASGGGAIERPRPMERRRVRETAEGAEPAPGQPEAPRRLVAGPREAPGPIVREMPPLESVVNTSVLLTVGQPLVLREDPMGRVTLTVRRLDK